MREEKARRGGKSSKPNLDRLAESIIEPESAVHSPLAGTMQIKRREMLSGKAKAPYQSRARVRVAQIIASTIELLGQHTPQDVTIAMIAVKANISRSSIYAHFKNIEEIYEQISVKFVEQSGRLTEAYVRSKNPSTLNDVLVHVIDAICEQFNNADRDGADGDLPYISLEVVSLVAEFDEISAMMYHMLWKVSWGVPALSEFDPFRILPILQTALFSVSIQRHGRITDEFVSQVKAVAIDFIAGAERRLRDSRTMEGQGSINSRIASAISAITSAPDPRLIETAIQQLEALARMATPLPGGDAGLVPQRGDDGGEP